MPVTDSPLRYPGGKSQLAPFVIDLMRANDLFYGAYAEPFAGGCGIAWKLLLNNYVSHVYINDFDRSIYSFWACVLRHSEGLCDRISSTRVTMKEWYRQRDVQSESRPRLFDLGFSTFFLNRTNRSGILKGGVIGGFDQSGDYLLDCRFNKTDLINKIQRIALHAEQVTLSRLDGEKFLRETLPNLQKKLLVNIDPPYFSKGPELYCSFYKQADHERLAKAVGRVKQPWMVTYDDTPEIRTMYAKFPTISKSLNYSAQDKKVGVEIMVLDPRLVIPNAKAAQGRAAA
jgi:DNA adenine methylase